MLCRFVKVAAIVGLCLLLAPALGGTRGTVAAALNGSAQAAGLKIVVVEGEDAVNIIQQKTAVAPVVEVRDRNNQPVAGAVVRFAIQGGRASFNGARTLSVTTNVAGRAAVSGLTPTASGAFQITASAAFEGQTAVATIAQTNVLTAAQAAGAAGASGAGGTGGGSAAGGAGGGGAAGGGAGGGGLSATTIGIVGGAAAGGTVLATQVLGIGGGRTTYRGSFSGIVKTVNGSCTIDRRHEGTVQLEIDVSDAGTVTGDGEVDATITLVAGTPTCGVLPINTVEAHGCCGPSPKVSGTTQSLGFNDSHPGNQGSVWIYIFTGALNNSQVTGTFTLTVRDPNGTETATFPVTLTPQ